MFDHLCLCGLMWCGVQTTLNLVHVIKPIRTAKHRCPQTQRCTLIHHQTQPAGAALAAQHAAHSCNNYTAQLPTLSSCFMMHTSRPATASAQQAYGMAGSLHPYCCAPQAMLLVLKCWETPACKTCDKHSTT